MLMKGLVLLLLLVHLCIAEDDPSAPDTANVADVPTVSSDESVPEESLPEESVPEESVPEKESVSKESVPEESVPEESVPEELVSEEESVPEESVPEEFVPEEESVPDEPVPEELVPEEESVPEEPVPEELVSEDPKINPHILKAMHYVLPEDLTTFIANCVQTEVTCSLDQFLLTPKSKRPSFHPQANETQPINSENTTSTRKPSIRLRLHTSETKIRFWNMYDCAMEGNEAKCPVDGWWGVWSSWGQCSSKCGEGTRNRKRKCNNPTPQRGGLPCHGLEEETADCNVQCATGDKLSGPQLKAYTTLQTFHDEHPNLYHGCVVRHCLYTTIRRYLEPFDAEVYWDMLHCYKYNRACPVDGKWSDWESWGNCTASCGEGSRVRMRTCNNPRPLNGGDYCSGKSSEVGECVGTSCPREGGFLTEWSKWSDCLPPGCSPKSNCTNSCDKQGNRVRTRTCYGSKSCRMGDGSMTSSLKWKKPCYTGACDVPGEWSEWSEWTDCSALCGTGRKTRLRMCSGPPGTGSLMCDGNELETTDCTVSVKDCNIPDMERDYLPFNSKESGDPQKYMDHPTEEDPYHVVLSPELEDQHGPWTPWSVCSATCGSGLRRRIRLCADEKLLCKGENVQQQFCNTQLCTEPGGWNNWLEWTPCTVTCGKGVRMRYRRCNNPTPKNGGTCIGKASQKTHCKMGRCAVERKDPSWSEWSDWSACSSSCGGGITKKKRVCRWSDKTKKKLPAVCKGQARHEHPCHTHPCPVRGDWSAWGEWTKCTSKCGWGVRMRERTCTDPAPVGTGSHCTGPATEILHCIGQPCIEKTDVGFDFESDSFLEYEESGKAAKVLLIFFRFKPSSENGVILHRHGNRCIKKKCDSHVTIRLKHTYVLLEGVLQESEFAVMVGRELEAETWHDVTAIILHDRVTLVVDNAEPSTRSFLGAGVNLDQKMVVGHSPEWLSDSSDHRLGFTGSLSDLRVNYVSLSLEPSSDWQGYGTPVKGVNVEKVKLDVEAILPEFDGNRYTVISTNRDGYNNSLYIGIALKPTEDSGLILYSEGEKPGSYITVYIRGLCFHTCVSSGDKHACATSEEVEEGSWHYISVLLDGSRGDIRLDNNHAYQLTVPGDTFRSAGKYYIGGAPTQEWSVLTTVTELEQGFKGLINQVKINHETHSLKYVALYTKKESIDWLGASEAARFRDVYESPGSTILLRCDYTNFQLKDSNATVRWLKGNHFLAPGKHYHITETVPGTTAVSELRLKPTGSKHVEDFYACLVTANEHRFIPHAFGVSFNFLTKDYTPEIMGPEMLVTIVAAVFVSVFLIMLLGAAFVHYRQRSLDGTNSLHELASTDYMPPWMRSVRESSKKKTSKTSQPGEELEPLLGEDADEEVVNKVQNYLDQQTEGPQQESFIAMSGKGSSAGSRASRSSAGSRASGSIGKRSSTSSKRSGPPVPKPRTEVPSKKSNKKFVSRVSGIPKGLIRKAWKTAESLSASKNNEKRKKDINATSRDKIYDESGLHPIEELNDIDDDNSDDVHSDEVSGDEELEAAEMEDYEEINERSAMSVHGASVHSADFAPAPIPNERSVTSVRGASVHSADFAPASKPRIALTVDSPSVSGSSLADGPNCADDMSNLSDASGQTGNVSLDLSVILDGQSDRSSQISGTEDEFA